MKAPTLAVKTAALPLDQNAPCPGPAALKEGTAT